MKRIALGLIALMTGLAGCSDTPPPLPKAVEVPAQSFIRKWSLDIAGTDRKTRVMWVRDLGTSLVAFTEERNAYVINKASGTLTAIDPIDGIGEVLAPFTNGKQIGYPVSTGIELFDITGKKVKTIEIGRAVESSGAFAPHHIIIGTAGEHGARMLGLDPQRTYDSPEWQVLVGGAVVGKPVWYSNAVYFSTVDGHVYSLDEEGHSAWPVEGGFVKIGRVRADVVADDFGVYLASEDTKLICLNRSTGRERWEYYAEKPLEVAPVVTAEMAYLTVRNQGLVALPKGEGNFHREALWVEHEATQFLAEDGRFSYVRLKNNAIGAIDRKTGALSFRSPPSDIDFFVSNPVSDGVIYGINRRGRITAITPVTTPGTIGSPMFIEPSK